MPYRMRVTNDIAYRRGMARPPASYDVDVLHVTPLTSALLVRTGPETGAPSIFSAACYVDGGRISVTGTVMLMPGGQAHMLDLAIRPGPAIPKKMQPVTTSMLRRVLIDQIVKAAVAEATVPMPAGADLDGDQVDERVQSAAKTRAEIAAKHYLAAQELGNKAPTEAVAAEMGVSRSQASRYIRAAREAGLLPHAGPGGNARVPYGHPTS